MRKRQGAKIAAAVTAALTLPLALGAARAQAEEAADLRTNQELLQQRIDQLAQKSPGAGAYLVPSTGGPVGVQMTGGSFPRSFLIPGTDTSIRVGGEIRLVTNFWITGGNPNAQSSTTNAGTTGQLNTIPLTGLTVGSSGWIARERSDNVFVMSPQQSKLSVETRTPTAWGEARSFIEFDFAGNTADSNDPLSTSNNLQPRLRYAYGTLGPLLFGQANSNFNDSDAGMESLEFGGLIGGGGPSRVPQIRWTQPLGGWGLLGALSVSAESPEVSLWAPGASTSGIFAQDPTSAVTLAPATGVFAPLGTPANPLKPGSPDLVAAWYIPQPWGHIDFGAVLRPALVVSTPFGAPISPGVDRTYMGGGGSFSGDVKPRWFGWDKDFFTWNIVGGQAMGRYLYAGSGSTLALVSNLTGNTLASNSVLIKPTSGFSGNIAYRHQWTDTIRSNVGVGIWRLDINGLNGVVCPAASRLTASGGCALNERLLMAKANVIWQPVAFTDFGLEYNYGQRKVLSGSMGNEHVITSRFRLRF
ncbi:MAG: porin [Alphaproteobacteria bacterium]